MKEQIPKSMNVCMEGIIWKQKWRRSTRDGFSDGSSLNEGMPQGTYLGPYVFLSMIDDLKSPLELHKFVNDCTLSEIIKKSGTNIMQQEMDRFDPWSSLNHMVINTKKTKEMLIGSIQKNQPPLLQFDESTWMDNEWFFSDMSNKTNCLHEILPKKRDGDVTGKLRDTKQYLVHWARTERVKKSTIVYALSHYQ